MVILPLTYYFQSLNHMHNFSETDTYHGYSHYIREHDADVEFLIDLGHPICGVFQGMPNRIVHITLLTHLFCFALDLCLFFSGHFGHCNRINHLMRLPVPFVESREGNSVLCAEFLYRENLRVDFNLVQKTKTFKYFTDVYHRIHSLNQRKGIIFPFHTKNIKKDNLHIDVLAPRRCLGIKQLFK